jgi:hypothetical protein
MNRKNYSIIMGLALLIAFFLPFYQAGGYSGLDNVKRSGAGWEEYLIALLPLSGLMLILGGVRNNYILSRGFWAVLPLLTILFLLIGVPLTDDVEFSTTLKSLGKGYGAGLWISIIASLVLAFYTPKG